MSFHHLRVLAMAGTLGLAPWAEASEVLRLEQAIARAVSSSPALMAELLQLDAAQAKAAREGLAPRVVLSAELENFAGSGTLRGLDAAEATLRLGRAIELGGKRSARQALGAAEMEHQRTATELARLDIRTRTALRFIEVAVDQQRLAFAQQHVQQAERTRREVARWVTAARNPESDLAAAEIALANVELEQEHAEHELDSARLALAALWGATSPDFSMVEMALSALPEPLPFEELVAQLPASIEQTLQQQEARTVAARLRVAEASQKPDLDLNIGIRHLQNTGDQALVLGVALPLGTGTRAAYAISEARAQLNAIDARRKAGQFERYQLLFEKYQELTHARTEIESLRTRVLPKAEQALAFTRRGFEAGRFSFLALSQAQQTLFDLRKRELEACARYYVLRFELDRLVAIAPERSATTAEDSAS